MEFEQAEEEFEEYLVLSYFEVINEITSWKEMEKMVKCLGDKFCSVEVAKSNIPVKPLASLRQISGSRFLACLGEKEKSLNESQEDSMNSQERDLINKDLIALGAEPLQSKKSEIKDETMTLQVAPPAQTEIATSKIVDLSFNPPKVIEELPKTNYRIEKIINYKNLKVIFGGNDFLHFEYNKVPVKLKLIGGKYYSRYQVKNPCVWQEKNWVIYPCKICLCQAGPFKGTMALDLDKIEPFLKAATKKKGELTAGSYPMGNMVQPLAREYVETIKCGKYVFYLYKCARIRRISMQPDEEGNFEILESLRKKEKLKVEFSCLAVAKHKKLIAYIGVYEEPEKPNAYKSCCRLINLKMEVIHECSFASETTPFNDEHRYANSCTSHQRSYSLICWITNENFVDFTVVIQQRIIFVGRVNLNGQMKEFRGIKKVKKGLGFQVFDSEGQMATMKMKWS